MINFNTINTKNSKQEEFCKNTIEMVNHFINKHGFDNVFDLGKFSVVINKVNEPMAYRPKVKPELKLAYDNSVKFIFLDKTVKPSMFDMGMNSITITTSLQEILEAKKYSAEKDDFYFDFEVMECFYNKSNHCPMEEFRTLEKAYQMENIKESLNENVVDFYQHQTKKKMKI